MELKSKVLDDIIIIDYLERGAVMGKKYKRKKNKTQRPPLTLLDKSIYWIGFFLSFLFSLLLIYCFEDITNMIAFRDPAVVAFNSHLSFLFAAPVVLYFECSFAIIILIALDGRIPIFGNPKIQYGEVPWAKDCFPLFDSRRKKIYTRPSHKRFRRDMMILWSVGLILCSMIAPFAFFGRDCLTHDNSIISYSILNQKESAQYTPEDYSHLNIYAKHVSGHRTADYWEYGITVLMKNGKSFTFSNRDFDWREQNNQEICLNSMLDIKEFFEPDEITIEGKCDIAKVIDYIGLNDKQTQLLQELFT